jgi:outer membrane protein OmpA-like peptidoglycan-associated protein
MDHLFISMIRKFLLFFLITLFTQLSWGQSDTYIVKKTSFSSDKYDEFSPVYYRNGIVFCTNRNSGFSNRITSQNKGLFKICYIDTTGRVDWENAKLFSKNLTTIFNDGPVTFTLSQDTIYYSRNQDVSSKMRDISGQRNKLGIFSASLIDGQWTKIRELRINNEWYNVTTPCLSPNGKRLYFASDKPGGFGGMDLYYSDFKNDYWTDPVNLGPNINTSGNEAYPFLNSSGELFFSSDGLPGLGGKDIFVTMISDSTWVTPVHLDPPVNSKSDDFGLVTNALMSDGYFSTNRDNSFDIYHFRANVPQVLYDNVQKENNYCFMFIDSGAIKIDTTNLKYVWDFGDGTKASGIKAYHCYKGAGKYTVKLDLVKRYTGSLFFSKLVYNIELKDYIQPYIYSPDYAVKGEKLNFDGLKSNLPEFRVLSYAWSFRDGVRSLGSSASHAFQEKGTYKVNLELTLQSESTGEIHKTGISKKIVVFNDASEKAAYLAKSASLKTPVLNIDRSKNVNIGVVYSSDSEFQKDAVFNVELLSSKTRLGDDNKIFRFVPKKYTINERFNPDDNTYSYIVDQEMTLMATYPAYQELFDLGFKDVRTKIYLLKDPSEKELHNLIKINGAFADSYFDNSNNLTSNAYIMLDQLVKLMNKYPNIGLEVAVHSDNTGTPEASIALSQTRAKLLVGYLINRGISSRRLLATGFGGSKPIASNMLEDERRLNRRVDFILLK